MKNKLVLTSIFVAAVLAVSAFALAVPASAQNNNFQQRYNNLVARVGAAGVGVETLLDNWEKADSADVNLLSARFNVILEWIPSFLSRIALEMMSIISKSLFLTMNAMDRQSKQWIGLYLFIRRCWNSVL